MSEMVYGPPFVIDGPVPEAPPFRLIDTAATLEFADPHWMNGVQVYPFPFDLPDATTPCLEGTFRVKGEGDEWPLPIFGPLTLFIAETCSSLSISSQEEFRARAELVLDATESFGVERQLIKGSFVPTNPYLGDSNVDLLASGAAVSPELSLALLEDSVGETGKQGLIHATPSIVSAWDSAGFTLIERGGKLYTRRGTPIAVGDGYIGQRPDGTPGLGATEQYAWASGPVQLLKDGMFMLPDNVKEALDREDNVITYRAERTWVVDWDTQLQSAVLVNLNA